MISNPQCYYCKHKRDSLTCAAFPDRIPRGVWLNEIDHRKPIKGDNGIRFEPVKQAKELAAA